MIGAVYVFNTSAAEKKPPAKKNPPKSILNANWGIIESTLESIILSFRKSIIESFRKKVL